MKPATALDIALTLIRREIREKNVMADYADVDGLNQPDQWLARSASRRRKELREAQAVLEKLKKDADNG